MRQLPFVGTLVGASLLACGLLGVDAAHAAQEAQAGNVKRDVQRSVAAFDAYFERARSMDQLLAENAVFSGFYTGHGGDRAVLQHDPELVDGLNDALAYLTTIYPTSIGEACFIDKSGKEVARVVDGTAAPFEDLSLNEQDNPFFRPSLALPVGVVYQAAPYRSADTNTLVISNSTRIQPTPNHAALVHFEISLASFLDYLPSKNQNVRSLVLDRRTGQLVLGVNGEKVRAKPTAAPADFQPVLEDRGATGQVTINGHRGFYREIAPSRGNANHWVVVEVPLGSAGPIPMWLAVAAASAGALLLLLALAALRLQQRTLRAAARLDHLTGLSNRLAAEEALRANISIEDAADRVGVLVLDLNGFKQINDTMGHHRGDQVLQEIARRLHANTFEYDLAARLGGDEFAVVLQNLTQPEDIMAVAERLHQALTRPIEVGGQQRFVGVSIGAAVFAEHGTNVEELFRNADAAMFAAKRDHAPPRLYTVGTDRGAEDLTLAAELLTAIEHRQIVLHYQPQVDLTTGTVVGMEALARWAHPERGLLPPSEFIGLAERTGLIWPLTQCTLDLAIDQAHRWYESGSATPVAVNLSPQLLADHGLAETILGMLEQRGLPPHLLALEITETAVLTSDQISPQTLTRLRNAGVRIDLDDFGSGFTSLTSLSELPLDFVKLDRSLLTGLATTKGGEESLRCLVELINRLGHPVVAEGIETVDQHQLALRAGCTYGQGFLYGRPVPAETLPSLTVARPR